MIVLDYHPLDLNISKGSESSPNQYHASILENGETIAVRLGVSDFKKIFRRKTAKSFFINLKCPNVPECGKGFEWEVKT